MSLILLKFCFSFINLSRVFLPFKELLFPVTITPGNRDRSSFRPKSFCKPTFTLSLSLSVSFCLCPCLSLTHTHTRTRLLWNTPWAPERYLHLRLIWFRREENTPDKQGGLDRVVLDKDREGGFPGGAVVESLPANAGDTGSSPDLGRSHMPRSD